MPVVFHAEGAQQASSRDDPSGPKLDGRNSPVVITDFDDAIVDADERLRRNGSSSEEQDLREAVTLSRLASVNNDGPLQLVSEELGVSASAPRRA
jgi:hypothetical protein